MQNLVIVESPTKARTLSRFLGEKYQVEASMGHVRDLPKSEMGVDIEHNFEPKYIIPKDKTKRVNELKKVAAGAKTLWLATDPDREGEAIAWHLKKLLVGSSESVDKKKKNSQLPTINFLLTKRVVFHEITEGAVKGAFESPRDIDSHLVDAQQARRVLDRLVGYRLSPLLWKKIKSGLSAGRVQSVAVRLIVEREREIKAFESQEYWSIEAELQLRTKPPKALGFAARRASLAEGGNQELRIPQEEARFIATLVKKDGKKVTIKNKEQADGHVKNLEKAAYQVSKVEKKEIRRHPSPPFTTSTMQQAASNKLGFTAKKTMSVAQNLYEHGMITYMRTDSLNLSPVALSESRKYIEANFGATFLPSKSRVFKTKSKVAQEAHEAIRPTDVRVTGDQLRSVEGLTRDHLRLYDLIWKRLIASQMAEAVIDQTGVDIKTDNSYIFRAVGNQIKFEGWLKVYGMNSHSVETSPDKQDAEDDRIIDQVLPELKEGEDLDLLKLQPEQHFTQPPARYTDASLIKKLEELGIGRPSTYAPTLSTIQERYYVEKVEKKFHPTEVGVVVTDFLIKNFPDVFDYEFTARMEDALDEVANGHLQWQKLMSQFYGPFDKKVDTTEEVAQKVNIEPELVDKICPECGKRLQIKFGRFGKFLACTGFPECKHTEALEEKLNIKCPQCGGEIVLRKTRKGRPFYGCKNWPNCKFASWTKPKSSGQTTDNVVDKNRQS